MKSICIGVGLGVALIVGSTLASRSLAQSDPNVVAPGAIHWHPSLQIFVKGQPVEIPNNLGIGPQFAGTRGYDPQMKMAALHTHDDLPLIHLEFMGGPVYKDNATLGAFFKLWDKDMRSFGTNLRMTVNGTENTEYESYVMHDGDQIVLNYE